MVKERDRSKKAITAVEKPPEEDTTDVEQSPRVTTAVEQLLEDTTASNLKDDPKENQQKANADLLIHTASERWKSLDNEIKNTFFEINIEEFRKYCSTDTTTSTIMEIVFPPTNTEDVSIRCSICFKCRQIFHGECEFRLHLGNHFSSYHMAQYLKVNPAGPQLIESIDTGPWKPIHLKLMLEQKKSGTLIPGKYPLSSNSERKRLVKEIGKRMKSLRQRNCLTESLMQFIRRVARREFKGIPSAPSPKHGTIRLVLCLLKPPSLREIMELLDVLLSDPVTDKFDDLFGQDASILDDDDPNIYFTSDKKSFVLNTEQFIGNENCENGKATKLMSWVFSKNFLEERLETWGKHMDQEEANVLKLFENVDKQSEVLRECWQRKHQLSAYAAAYRSLKKLLKDESVKDLRLNLFNILCKRKMEHYEAQWHLDSFRIKYECSAIARIVAEAKRMSFDSNSDNEKAISEPSSHQISNESLQTAIHNLKKQTAFEIMKTEARVNVALYKLQLLAFYIRLRSTQYFDYTLMPLIKSFLRARLEDLGYNDTTSGASEEAIAKGKDADL